MSVTCRDLLQTLGVLGVSSTIASNAYAQYANAYITAYNDVPTGQTAS